MAEQILPGVSIEVRPEGLIIPGRISIGTIGIIGTASRGAVDTPISVGNLADAFAVFGEYDNFTNNQPNELTLTRALEQAFSNAAQNVIAIRVASGTVASADLLLSSASGDCVTLSADSAGTWGNDISVNVSAADDNSFISNETHIGPAPITLTHPVVVESARNRISVFRDATQQTNLLVVTYDGGDPLVAGQVEINRASGVLTFFAGEEPAAADVVTASYVVSAASSVKVTLKRDGAEESYNVASGNDLVADINANSSFAVATVATNSAELPSEFASAEEFQVFTGGDNGTIGANYVAGLDLLNNEPAHVIIAAGQTISTIGTALTGHCNAASSDLNKRERIGVVGSDAGASVDDVAGHQLNSDRIIYVAPGIQATDRTNSGPVTLSGGYAAAAVAGLISSFSSHISLTNKQLTVNGLEQIYTSSQLIQLLQNRVLALENKFGFRVVKGITSSTNTAWHQITTRRTVDFAKFGVRSAANSYIGLLNNDRVRSAMRSTINSFLTEMVDAEQLISYELEVSATRDEEIKGIARVTLVLRPTFSIDFIKVTMFLE